MLFCGKEDFVVTKDDKRKFLQRLLVTDEDVLRIAEYEQRTPAWFQAREFRLTGSRFGAAAGHNKYSSRTELLQDILWGTFTGNAATEYGTVREPYIHDIVQAHEVLARQQHFGLDNTGVWLQPCGLIVSKKYPWLGVSPDDFIMLYDSQRRELDIGLAEYKAPAGKCKHTFYGECPHYYYDQFQGQMAVAQSYLHLRFGQTTTLSRQTGTWTKFCVWSPNATQINAYNLDPAYWDILFAALKTFYMNELLPLYILKERGVLREGEIGTNQVVNIKLPPAETTT